MQLKRFINDPNEILIDFSVWSSWMKWILRSCKESYSRVELPHKGEGEEGKDLIDEKNRSIPH